MSAYKNIISTRQQYQLPIQQQQQPAAAKDKKHHRSEQDKTRIWCSAHTTSVEVSCVFFKVLLANRAEVLMMVGAYKASSADCKAAIVQSVADPIPRKGVPLITKAGPVLTEKLYTRLGRALLKLEKLMDWRRTSRHPSRMYLKH